MTYKCKICGGQTALDIQNGIAVCEYCGTKQALPLFTDDSERMLYERGNNYLLHSEYDKAENVFNQLLTIKPSAAELYWDLVLCKYGVTYVKDPKTQKYIPTCNRTHYTSVFSDENYKKALKLSSGEKKALFETDAKTIDNIQKGIIAVSKKEKPFDIFISYKETGSNGNRTKDSIEAQKLYEKLTNAGYKVFFSRITLENKIGFEYEPYIYAALYSSKVMLTICSSKENIEAAWVKNEWSRFLSFRQNDSSKSLLPLYFNMDKTDLPEEFALLPAYDMSADGFTEELIRGIKKLIPLPIMLAAKRKKRKEQAKIISLTALCIFLASVLLCFPYAINYFEHIGDYNSAMELYNSGNYDEAKEMFTSLEDFKNSEEMIKNCDYDTAMQLYYDGDYPQAAWAFRDLNGFKDSSEMQSKSELSWRKSLANVATNDLDTFSTAYYIINENGTVSSVDGNANTNLSIEKHGKIISITPSAEKLYALHEDGYVSNIKENNHISDDSEWHDIIKISRQLDSTNIALRADGKMLYGNIESGYSDVINDDWISDIEKWTDIVDFELLCLTEAYGDLWQIAIIGIKSDGSLCVANSDTHYISLTTAELNKIFKDFSIKSLSVNLSDDLSVEIMAITNDGKLLLYKNGELSQSDIDDVCATVGAKFLLKTNGDLVNYYYDETVLQDIVKVCYIWDDAFAVTRTGNIYMYELFGRVDFYEWEKSDIKTHAYDEWIERLN